MSNEATRAQAMLDAWREQGAHRIDPVRFHFIEALARRSAGRSGTAGQLLEKRLIGLLDAYGRDVAYAASQASGAQSSPAVDKPAPGPLAQLVSDLDQSHVPARECRPDTSHTMAQSAAYPEMPVLDDFREIWSRMSTQKQLRQSLAQVPGNPGPLNSSSLVHRSLSLMQALSPGYLQHFLAYADALSWMEQITGAASASAAKAAHRVGKSADPAKKPRRASGL